MARYVCSICGFTYDEDLGLPSDGLPAGTKWSDIPDDWHCPMCGAPKSAFEKEGGEESEEKKPVPEVREEDELTELSSRAISIICSNLARGAEKQYREEESKLFSEIAEFYRQRSRKEEGSFEDIIARLNAETEDLYVRANATESDRGAKRVLLWSGKVTKILSMLARQYKKEGASMLEGKRIWVCDICGFVYIGDKPPAVCPVCKVPSLRILEVTL